MKRHVVRIRLAALALFTLAVCLSGCMPSEDYESCGFFTDLEEKCEEGTSDGSANNCVILEHPQCPNDYCVSYRASKPFCSAECLKDADCPSGGSCVEFAINCGTEEGDSCLKLCVKNSALK